MDGKGQRSAISARSQKLGAAENAERPTPNAQCSTSNSDKRDVKLHRRKREQGWENERLHTGAGWFHSLDCEGPGGRAASGTRRRARRVAGDRTAICRSAVGNGSGSRTDRDHVVARSKTRCAERTSSQRSDSSANRRFLYALTCPAKSA